MREQGGTLGDEDFGFRGAAVGVTTLLLLTL